MPDRNEKNIVLFVSSLCSFFSAFMLSAVNIAVPAIGLEFDMNAIWLNWVTIAFMLTSTVLMVPFSKLADKYGYKKIFLIGNIVFMVFCILTPLAKSAVPFIILRALNGIGAAMFIVTGMAMLISAFPANERGRAIGISLAAVYLGISAGPFLGGILTQYWGWHSVFWAPVPFLLVIVISVVWKLKTEWTHPYEGKFDWAGAIIYSISLVGLLYGLAMLPDISGIWIVLASIVFLLLFIWIETRTKNPVMEINLFRRSRLFAFSNLAALISYSAIMSIAFLLSLYLQYNRGMSATEAGLVLVAQPFVQAIVSPFAGRLSDRVEPVYLASMGMGITTLGLVCLGFTGANTQIWFIILGTMIVGLGCALFVSPNTNAIMGTVDKSMYAAANATLSTMRQLGGMVSQAIVMVAFALIIGQVVITSQYYGDFLTSMKIVLFISAGLCFIGIFLSLARGKR